MTDAFLPSPSNHRCERCLFLKDKLHSSGCFVLLAEVFRSRYREIHNQLSSLAEAISRPSLLHEYHVTPFSLGSAVTNGVSVESAILFFLQNCYGLEHSNGEKTALFIALRSFLEYCMTRYNLARVVINRDATIILCKTEAVLRELSQDPVVQSVLLSEEVKWKKTMWDREENMFPYLETKGRVVSRVLCKRCVEIGYPLSQQYDYERDLSLRTVNICLNSQCRPRNYQVEAVEAATKEEVLSSGVLVVPCGGGKTLIGIMLICKVKKPTIIICAGSISVDQWKNQILSYASFDSPSADCVAGPVKTTMKKVNRIACLTSKQKDEISDETDVVITTYSMLVSAFQQELRKMASTHAQSSTSDDWESSRKRRTSTKEKLFSTYGLLILDEVHVIPANAFRESVGFVDAKAVIGLTATYVREDNKIKDIFHLVGPKLYEISSNALAKQGFLATVQCVEVHIPMSKEFGIEYLERSMRKKGVSEGTQILVLLAAANPNKMICVRDLVAKHLSVRAKILVFCDHISLLREYGLILQAPVVCGSTPIKERLMIFSDFQTTNRLNVVCVSRVGDVSVNLPSANVVIQVSSHGGSRRQEAQRLGRILRPKGANQDLKEIQAWFYSIVSTDTLEMYYAAHRTAFLVDQGYSTRIVEYIPMSSNSESPPSSSGMKSAPVGDHHSVKREELNRTLGVTPLTSLSTSTSDYGSQCTALEYQIQLLAKIVSKWEFEYQKHSNHDGSDSEIELVNSEDAAQKEPERTFNIIKNEWNGGNATLKKGKNTAIESLVGADDDFVYHEL